MFLTKYTLSITLFCSLFRGLQLTVEFPVLSLHSVPRCIHIRIDFTVHAAKIRRMIETSKYLEEIIANTLPSPPARRELDCVSVSQRAIYQRALSLLRALGATSLLSVSGICLQSGDVLSHGLASDAYRSGRSGCGAWNCPTHRG